VLKDLGAQNGTLLNGAEAKVAVLRPNDQIKVGSITIFFEEKAPAGNTTAMREIEQEMEVGKGYRTILRQIVSDSNPPRKTEGK
jgi:pSer/pThr/pTyr-binding forkhead associated (FHA) protein